MSKRKFLIAGLLTVAIVGALTGCAREEKRADGKQIVRLGYFPNVTHAQALIGVKRGDFQKALGDNVALETQTINAGPSVIEAVFAGHLDIAYVGPSPILNGFLQSKGEEVRVVSGSAVNGVLVIGNKKRGITKLEQIKGGRIATPQFANTQDISAKHFVIKELGAKLKSEGGETDVVPIANPDIETLFEKNQLDAAWVPEPWGSRIIVKGLANLVAEEKDLWENKSFPITNVIVRREFLEKHQDLVVTFLRAHIAITRELAGDPQSFATLLNDELKRLTGKSLPGQVIAGALKYTGFDYNLEPAAFEKFFSMGRDVKLIKKDSLDVNTLIVEEPLKIALTEASSTATENLNTTAPAEAVTTSTGDFQ